MTTDTLFDALEICLQALDQGADVESCLARYPALADELRPILITAVQARTVAVTEVPADAARRGKARVLQAAAEMREQQNAAPVLPFWRKKGFFGARFYRLAVTTAIVIAFLLTGGTGLVNASNGALPGDSLYPVKRSWEGIQLAFVFDQKAKAELEHKFDHKRVQEIEELYSEKRIEQVNFQGVVESQQTGLWVIGGLQIAIEDETVYVGEITLGATVQVIGETDDGILKAERIVLISAPNAASTAMPVPQILQTTTPEGVERFEESQMPEAGDDSRESNSEETVAPDKSGESVDSNDTETKDTETKDAEIKDESGSGQDGGSESGDSGDDGGDD